MDKFITQIVVNTANLDIVTEADEEAFQNKITRFLLSIDTKLTKTLASTLWANGNYIYLTLDTFTKLAQSSSNTDMLANFVSIPNSHNVYLALRLKTPKYELSESNWKRINIHPNYTYLIKHLQGYSPYIKQKEIE